MDDCDLERFAVKPGKLEPKFKKEITQYNVTLQSNIEKIVIDPLPRDNGASWCLVGRELTREISLPEGETTEINVEVTAEDGRTKKNYIIHAKRLSAKDAFLISLQCDKGVLVPPFTSSAFDYTCLVPCGTSEVTIKAAGPDSKNVVTLGDDGTNFTVSLKPGNTNIVVYVQSIDQSKKQPYTIKVTRQWTPRYIKIKDPSARMKFECPISLSPLHCPVWIRDTSPKHLYTGQLIDEVTKTNKIDFLSGSLLEGDWRVQDEEMELNLEKCEACIPLTYGGYSDVMPLTQVTSLLKTCAKECKLPDLPQSFTSKSAPAGSKIVVQSWEKKLHQIYETRTAAEHMVQVDVELSKYYQFLSHPDKEDGMAHLLQACYCCASAIKENGKDSTLHLRLGQLLEELYYAEDIHGHKAKVFASDDLPSFDSKAKESSKAEECDAICHIHGVGSGASVARKLQAIDKEYHQLRDSGQSAKSDHVQDLYAWLSKQVKQEGVAAQKATDTESPLGQAYLKYVDALILDESKASHNFHVGRLLVVQGNYKDAVGRLEAALTWNNKHEMARVYLGLALGLHEGADGSRSNEAIGYLLDGMELLLTTLSEQAMCPKQEITWRQSLMADSLVDLTNVYFLRSLNVLGTLVLRNTPKDSMSAADIFHHAALLSSYALTRISRGNTYKQVEWVLLEAHSNLLQILSAAGDDQANKDLICMRCQRLSGLISHSTIPKNTQLMSLQLATTQKLVQIQPCNGASLSLLGTCQYDIFDNSPSGDDDRQMLNEARLSFLACISLEGKPASGDAPDYLKEQSWWKKLQEESEKMTKSAPTADTQGKAAAGRGGATARGAPVRGRGTAAPAARGAASGRGAARGSPAAGKPTAGRGATTTPGRGASKAATKTSNPKLCASTEHAAKMEETKPVTTVPSAPAPINAKSFQARLGLARVYGAQQNTVEAQKYYQEVIMMAPEVHDAYIEAGNILLKTDPVAALDIYCLYPVAETPTFEDAYIYGEVLSILMKKEMFDDDRLPIYMVAWGTTMGIGCLDKYVSILEGKGKMKMLRKIFSGLHKKPEDHPDLQAFFKFKCW